MINANELYENNNKEGKSPGQWLALKSTKKLLEQADFQHEKTDDCYLFDKQLAFHYEYHLNPLAALESLTEVKSDMPDETPEVEEEYSALFLDLYKEILNAAIQANFHQKVMMLSGMSLKETIKYAQQPIKQHILNLTSVFDTTFQVKIDGLNQLKQKARSAAQHLPPMLFNRGDALFADNKFEYFLSKTNTLSQRKKQ